MNYWCKLIALASLTLIIKKGLRWICRDVTTAKQLSIFVTFLASIVAGYSAGNMSNKTKK